MARELTFELMEKSGFYFPYATDIITSANRDSFAMDAMLTSANSAVPAEFSALIDPTVIQILTAKRGARLIAPEVKKGDWTTSYMKFRVDEFTGVTTPYSDEGDGAVAGINVNWLTREQYRFQTTIGYGDFEAAYASTAKIDLIERRQQAAADIIDSDSNKFYLYGVANRDIVGLLNDPNLPAVITPDKGAEGSIKWTNKTTSEIFEDILKLYRRLVYVSKGNVDMTSNLCLVISPALSVELGKATDFNISAQKMIDDYFKGSLEIITIPEMDASEDETYAYMIARTIKGTPTLEFAFSEKMRAGRVVPELSRFKQKFSSTTYGCIIYRPFGVAIMAGL